MSGACELQQQLIAWCTGPAWSRDEVGGDVDVLRGTEDAEWVLNYLPREEGKEIWWACYAIARPRFYARWLSSALILPFEAIHHVCNLCFNPSGTSY